MAMDRRSFLRGAVAVPGGAVAMGAQAKLAQAGMLAQGGGVLSGGFGAEPVPSSGGSIRVSSFLQYLKAGGEAELRRRARHVSGLDPDLIDMRSLSFAAKVRAQRQRNYERLLAERRVDIDHRLGRDGPFDWWP